MNTVKSDMCNLSLMHQSKVQKAGMDKATLEQLFLCTLCGEAYCVKQELLCHMKDKHSKENQCLQCGTHFRNSDEMKNHKVCIELIKTQLHVKRHLTHQDELERGTFAALKY